MIAVSEIEKILKTYFSNSQVLVEDLTGSSDHFQVWVVSSMFQGKNLVEQHQMVYQALRDQMKEAIHALTLKTYTPEDWQKLQANQPGPKSIT